MAQLHTRLAARRSSGKDYRQRLGRNRLLASLEADNVRLRETVAQLTYETQRLRDALTGRSTPPPAIWSRLGDVLQRRYGR